MESKTQTFFAILFLALYAFFLIGLPIIGFVLHQIAIAIIPLATCILSSIAMCIITMVHDIKMSDK